MKTKSFRAVLILVGLMLVGVQPLSAGVGETFKKFIGNEFSNFQGLYIIAGVVVASLLVYILFNRNGAKEKEMAKDRRQIPNKALSSRYHHHHHQHRVVKKTQ